MRQCTICKEREGETKTIDIKPICYKCYIIGFNELFKGQFSTIELEQTLQTLKEYRRVLNTYLFYIRQLAVTYKVSVEELLTEVMTQENMMSIELYRKTRNCLTRAEHLDIMQRINTFYRLTNLDADLEEGGDLQKDIRKKYLYGCSYLSY